MDADLELLEAWRAGDSAAGNQLFERHFLAIYRFFRAKLEGDLDDLVQRAFAACVEARTRLQQGSSFRAYLYACARRILQDHLRQQYRGREDLDPELQSVEDLGTSPSELFARKREHRLLLRALRRIPMNQQIALELFYWEQLEGAEIAAVLEIPEGTVRTYLNRGRANLAERMRELADDTARVETTLDNLARWADSVRAALEPTT